MNPSTLAALSANPPPKIKHYDLSRDIYARTVQIETELGLPVSRFTLNTPKAQERLQMLEQKLAAKDATAPAPTATVSDAQFINTLLSLAALTGTAADTNTTKTRAEFEAMKPKDRMAFMRDGGKLID